MPAFAVPLVLLRLLVNLLAFRNSGFSLLRRVYTLGLDGRPAYTNYTKARKACIPLTYLTGHFVARASAPRAKITLLADVQY
jgi:hypothetical protein